MGNMDYCNEAIWVSTNRRNGHQVVVGGPMAELLLKYPEDYKLTGPLCWTPFIEEV